MNHSRLFVLVLTILRASPLFAQGDIPISVRKPAPCAVEFRYHDRPISPEALIDMFMGMEDGSSVDSVSLLLHPYRTETLHDTSEYCRCKQGYMGWLYRKRGPVYEQVIDSTQDVIMGAFVSYCIRGKTSGKKFIVEAAYNSGGSLTYQSLFILDIRGDYLIKLAEFMKDYDTKYDTFEIKRSVITLGPKTFAIPASAR